MTSKLENLPSEIVELIIQHLENSFSLTRKALLGPLSLTSKVLRQTTIPLIFAKVTISIDQRWSGTRSFAKFLNSCSHMLPWTQTVSIIAQNHGNITRQDLYRCDTELRNALSSMTRLTKIECSSYWLPNLFVDMKASKGYLPQTGVLVAIIPQEKLPFYIDLGQAVPALAKAYPTWSFSVPLSPPCTLLEARDFKDLLINRLKSLGLTSEMLVRISQMFHGGTGEDFRHLEELSVGDMHYRGLYRGPGKLESLSPGLLCPALSMSTALRRLGCEGQVTVSSAISILPDLPLLEDLRLYSPYKIAFHPEYDHIEDDIYNDKADLTKSQLTTQGPWTKLPRLKHLWLRYICNHFQISQLIPKGLLSLRIEFYHASDFFNASDLQQIAQLCPDLQTLEIDMSQPTELSRPHPSINVSDIGISLPGLSNFKHLRVLRLCPTYWENNTLLPHPFPSFWWPHRAFQHTQAHCPTLEKLIISISKGEYPTFYHSRFDIEKRPIKFVVHLDVYDELVFSYSFPNNGHRVCYISEGEDVYGSRSYVDTDPAEYFDEMGGDWTVRPFRETVVQAHIDPPDLLWSRQGRSLLDRIESQIHRQG